MFLLQLEAVKLLLRGLLLGTLSAFIALLLNGWGALAPLERGTSTALFQLRGTRAPQSGVTLLVIDEATARRAGKMPLPRRFYAQALQKLRSEGARVIAFNFVFSSASDDPKQDALVQNEVAARRDVTQGVIFDVPGATLSSLSLRLLPAFALSNQGATARPALSPTAPLAAMMAPQSGVGHLNFRPEPGGEVRRIPHLIGFNGQLYPSLALSAAIQLSGETAPDWVAAAGQIRSENGRITVPIDRNGESLVNWLGGDGTFPVFSLVQLLDGRIPRGALRGATVFVGNSRAGTFTTLTTPFSPPIFNNQSALHLQANAFDDIVSNRVLRPLPVGFQALTLVVFSLGAGAILARRGAWGALGWIVVGSLALWSIGVLLLFFNFALPLATPQIALLLTGATCLGVRQWLDAGELRVMHELFDGYVGDEVLRAIKNKKRNLNGELQHVAILFCDIRGFSALAEGLRDDPAKLIHLLNDHFEPIVQSLKDHGAYVDNYVGDLVMAVFGAPVSEQASDRNSRSAVLAALDVLRIVKARNVEREAAGVTRIDIGVGVHCGVAVVGVLGTKKKHYTALGDTVNIASRVESETRAFRTELLITEEVVRACQDHPETQGLSWEFIAETPGKGRQGNLRLYSTAEAQQNWKE